MSLNINPWPTELLSWHGHDRGGIRVPFQPGNRPIPTTIETGLIGRLRELANRLSQRNTAVPRWIFLVGGPGNGKSETVEDFLRCLDRELGLQGRLIGHLTQCFSRGQLLQRRVEVLPTDVAPDDGVFRAAIGRLVLIQDATATEDPQGDAARSLAQDLVDLYTTNENPPPLLIVCANRGLLARSINESGKDYGNDNYITKLLGEIIRASGLGFEALSRDRKPCWPLASYPQAACWPLDLESLLESNSGATAPMAQALSVASDLRRWDTAGRCLDCDARENCPLKQNADWLREPARATRLIHILRRGELSTGQRWNFRGVFSLVAETSVGQWQDFEGYATPCEWVHAQCATLADDTRPAAFDAAYWLTRRLYPHALFAAVQVDDVARRLQEFVTSSQPWSQRFLSLLTTSPAASVKHIREYLLAQYANLDPAITTPASGDHVLRSIEDDYSQSVELGNSESRTGGLAGPERSLLWFLERAEAEWDRLGRASLQAASVSHLLRRFASIFVKRAVGVALGHHANENVLDEYADSLRDRQRLNRLSSAFQGLLGPANAFQFNIVETFGQPQTEQPYSVRLVGPQVPLRSNPAPISTDTSPSHDIPCFEISDTKYRIPITFDLFLALKLRQAGCASASLPSSVRASIDRVRHRYAGSLCRDTDKFLDQIAAIEIAGKARIVLNEPKGPLSLEPI